MAAKHAAFFFSGLSAGLAATSLVFFYKQNPLEQPKLVFTTKPPVISIESLNPYDAKLLELINQRLIETLSNTTDKAKLKALETCKYGLPSHENLSFRSSYVSSINYERRIPNWVMECIEKED
ncbi:endonuclease G, partial [Reticulomyxa filosa]